MDAPEARFLVVVEALLAAGGNLLALHERAAFVAFGRRGVVAVLWPSLRGEMLAERLHELLVLEPRTPLTLVAVSDDADAREVLERVVAKRSWRRKVAATHVDVSRSDGEEPWTAGSSLPEAVVSALTVPVPENIDMVALRAQLHAHGPAVPTAEEQAVAEEHRAFALKLRQTPTPLTWLFLGSIAVAFALELWFGGSEWPPALVRLGANLGSGEGLEHAQAWWRFGSSAFLHAGWMHVIINGYVLYALGTFLERVIGRARFAIVYVAAAFAGGFASATWSDSLLSVGASGAIWGLLGASAALAFRPGRLLPKHLAGPMRRTALINLALNLSISFLPRIDLLAHIGGGIAGVLVMLALGEVHRREVTHAASRGGRIARVGQGTLALALLGLLFGAFATAVVHGRPWLLRNPTVTQWQQIGAELAVPVPALLGEPVLYPGNADEVSTVYQWGDLLTDPFVVVVIDTPLGTVADPEAYAAEFVDAKVAVPDGATLLGERRKKPGVFQETYLFPNGLRSLQRYRFIPARDGEEARRIGVEVTLWPGASESWQAAAVDVLEALAPMGR